ncbi:MAG: metallophosphoesterase [Dysgonamonadaceae bacterium]|jgi:5'-nucleotidase|nr:metallophosphoesterase [Dysgonamonadaceae bacterium]
MKTTSLSPTPPLGGRGIILILLLALSAVVVQAQEKSLVVLHINDTHSRIEPFPENQADYSNKGGMVRLDNYVNQVRKEEKNVLLFHCGDLVQGTPYFNWYKGDAEIAAANLMKTDAACLGNHEFDNGLELLSKMIKQAKFPFIATNLDFSGTLMDGLTKKYHILKRNGIKIGVIGLTISPDGLVSKSNSAGVKYLDPVESANTMAAFLKEKEKCDLIICLSHLGYYPKEERDGDITIAKKSHYIDIILGGHTHTFMPEPDKELNADGREVIINQTGAYGVYFGRMNIIMEEKQNDKNKKGLFSGIN